MIFTRSKLIKLSIYRRTLSIEVFDNSSENINDLTKKMDNFATKFDCAFSELQISKTYNSLLCKQIVDLQQFIPG